ncbi:MAG: peptide-methionine (S)-S-oxide reductase MsrA [Nanoarchaeota archaeon]
MRSTENENSSIEIATLAGGCFWCMESPYEKLQGVTKVVSGYSGGDVEDPSYEQVSSGATGHREAVQVYYDPEKISYKKILDVFWRQIDPADAGGQFADRGFQYTTAIFYHSSSQKEMAEESKREYQEYFDEPIVTSIEEFMNFYPAEEYHQDYYKKNPLRYKFYRTGSGRDRYLDEQWNE